MGIKYKDFIAIYFENLKDLFDVFQVQFKGMYQKRANAVQHRNAVKFIWSMIDEKLRIFPQNLLSTIYILTKYHAQTMQGLRKKVQYKQEHYIKICFLGVF